MIANENTMDLNEFVNKSLKAIIDGVTEAQSYAKEKGAKINPANINTGTIKYWTSSNGVGQDVEFDIAVVVNESQEGSKSAGIKVWGIGAEGKKIKESENTTNSRIRFSVLLFLPPQN
ncbi:MAG: hypothetical protein HZB98_15070 [Bacteroidia bacterium]|nr:hypothetical protein [Bacteroidia bacterium]